MNQIENEKKEEAAYLKDSHNGYSGDSVVIRDGIWLLHRLIDSTDRADFLLDIRCSWHTHTSEIVKMRCGCTDSICSSARNTPFQFHGQDLRYREENWIRKTDSEPDRTRGQRHACFLENVRPCAG